MNEEKTQLGKNSKKIRILAILSFLLIFGGFIIFLFNNLDTPTQYKGGKLGGKDVPTINLTSMKDSKNYSI